MDSCPNPRASHQYYTQRCLCCYHAPTYSRSARKAFQRWQRLRYLSQLPFFGGWNGDYPRNAGGCNYGK